jgi:hypothetical protein
MLQKLACSVLCLFVLFVLEALLLTVREPVALGLFPLFWVLLGFSSATRTPGVRIRVRLAYVGSLGFFQCCQAWVT